MLGIFIDLSRAFDTLSHEIPCNKLIHYGIRGIALEWIRDYLSKRKQYVMYVTDMGVGSIRHNTPDYPFITDHAPSSHTGQL